MKKIIVPIDFSKCSSNALKNAITIAQRLNSELILCHSLTSPVGFAEGAGIADYGFDELQKDARHDLLELVKKSSHLKELKYKIVVEFGPLQDLVNAQFTSEDKAMVVMGTHGAKGFLDEFMGTNAYNVIKHANCPVLVLPETSDITQMSKIALAGDYKSVTSPYLLHSIIDLAKAFYAHLSIVHIDHEHSMEHHQIEIAMGMEKYFKHGSHSFHFRQDVDIEEGLISFVKEEKVHLLAMISRHKSFIDRLTKRSETKSLAMHIPMPIMVLKE
jgi:nucleotide-binding universal stress UspA family protein